MKTLITVTLLLISFFLSAQMNPEEVVQKQLETYNDRNINGFMSAIDADITMHDFDSSEITVVGYDACKKVYTELFTASPSLHSKILTRIVFKNKVIDHEYITERKRGNTPVELALIYKVNHEKMNKITVLKKQD